MHKPPYSKRNKSQVRRDQLTISDLYLQGWPLSVIRDKLNARKDAIKLSEKDVWAALKALRKDWAVKALDNMDQFIQQELARIDKIETQYWAGWEASKTKTITDGCGNTRTIDMPGDSKFLDGMLKCSKQRVELLRPALNLTVNANAFTYMDMLKMHESATSAAKTNAHVVDAKYKEIG